MLDRFLVDIFLISNIFSRCEQDPELLKYALEEATFYGNSTILKILQPLYKDESSLDRLINNAVEADCEATVALVKQMFDDNQKQISEETVEVARSRAVRRVVELVQPGHEVNMEQRKQDLRDNILNDPTNASIQGRKKMK